MEILENISLKNYNTFGLDVSAKNFCTLKNEEDFITLSKTIEYHSQSHLILGGGSNILFTEDYNGLIIKNEIKGIEVVEENEDEVIVKVGSGEIWHSFVLYAINQNWGGIENLSLIPGTVGAAPIQNIGAYGTEVKDIITKVDVIDKKSLIKETILNSECDFDYRNSIFKSKHKGQYLILYVYFKLNKNSHQINSSYGAINKVLEEKSIVTPNIKDISNAVIKIRQSKLPDPAEIGNAGSFFKNPIISKDEFDQFIKKYPEAPHYTINDSEIKVPAGWLIEQCGWKGKVVGNTGSHKNQALVLVNYGNANGDEIRNLAFEIVKSVKNQYGIDIEPEVNII